MAKPKVVFDTNVFLRALINPDGINAQLVRSRTRYKLITSAAILQEVVEVFSRGDLLKAKAIGKIDAGRLITILRRARRVVPTVRVRVSRDPDDDKFLEAALAAKARHLVTGDKDLRDIGDYKGIKIRFPGEFLMIPSQVRRSQEARARARAFKLP